MIRFSCASCQKVLSAPDDKVGMRLMCPGCRQPVQVPAAAAASQAMQAARPAPPPSVPAPAPSMPGPSAAAAGPDFARPPFFKRFLTEMGAVVGATFRQSLKPFTLLFEILRRNSLRKQATAGQFALGQRMYESEVGDAKLRGRIKALGERIHSIQDVKGDARQAIAERKDLIMQLAAPALASESVADAVAGEHQRARTVKGKLQSQEEALQGAMGGFMPPNALAWRRVAIGYTMAAVLLLGFGWTYWAATAGSRMARQQDRERLASRQAADEKRQQDDSEWAKEKDSEAIYDRCSPSVAMIKLGDEEGGGTGFMIRPGIIATNAHVVQEVLPEDLKIYYPSVKDLAGTAHAGRVVYFDAKRDLALLAVEPKVPPLRLADNFEFKGGKRIFAIGCPSDGEKLLPNAISPPGSLSTKTEVMGMPYYQISVSVNGGNSGGPVFDNRGQVIGIVTLKASRKEGIAYCIPWDDLKSRLDAVEKEDPHKTAAAGQANHAVMVMFQRVFFMADHYADAAAAYAIGRRDIAAAILGEATSENLMDSRHQAVGARLVNDPNLPAEVRKNYSDLWKTYEDLKGLAERPGGNLTEYRRRTADLTGQFHSQVKVLAESLGFETERKKKKR
jgi:S1-C subfamily serine protease